MKILLIVDDFLPNSTKIAAVMMFDLAWEFQRQGHQVRVLTPKSELPQTYEISDYKGVSVWRFKNGSIKNVNKIKRAMNESLLSFSAWRSFHRLFKASPADLIVYYCPSIFWGGLIRKLKKLWQAKSYLILRDIFPQWAIDAGLLRKNSPITGYFRYFERKNYAAADTIGVMSVANLRWFQSRVSHPHAEVLYNWYSGKPTQSDGSFRRKHKLQNKKIFFYGGNLGLAQQMENLLSLAQAMRSRKDAVFIFLGSGDAVPMISESIKQNALSESVLLLPAVSQTEYIKILGEVDVGLISLHRDHVTHNFPGKVLGYFNQSIPVLGCVNEGNDLRELLNESGAGLISLSGDLITLHNNAEKFMDAALRKKMGAAGKRLLRKKFSVQNAVKQVLNCV